ncbi:hypothetical protein ACHAXT_005620 [Thalassiosira profunda]
MVTLTYDPSSDEGGAGGAVEPVVDEEVMSISSTAAIDPRNNNADITAQADSDSKTSSSDGTGSNNDADSEADEIEERAWKCHKCGRHNHLHKLRCPPPCRACKGQSWKSTRTSTEGCEIVWGAERNGDECAVCGDGGELICCDTCDKAYHAPCIHVEDAEALPDPWKCPACDPKATRKDRAAKEKRGENDDACFICYDGGLLVCCDYCEKSFHMHCHVPPLEQVPRRGKWKCCECAASSFSKRFKCGQCEACQREDCGKCLFCLDKPKFGGRLLLKQVCVHKRCPYKRYALPAKVVTPMAQKAFMRRTKGEGAGGDALDEEEGQGLGDAVLDGDERKPAAVAKMDVGRECQRKCSGKQAAAVAAPVSPATGQSHIGSRKRASSFEVDGDASSIRCQIELKRLREENRRQKAEIKRLKSAVKALTASLTE